MRDSFASVRSVNATGSALKGRLSKAITAVLFAITALLFVTSSLAGDPGPVIPKGQGDECVADTAFMRRNHMDLMVHQRDDTVLEGIRGAAFSLSECVDCHAQKDEQGKAIRVDDKGQFCQSCHSYAAVKIDCFSCHAAVPDSSDNTAGLRPLPNKDSVTAGHSAEPDASPVAGLGHSLADQIKGHLQTDAQ
ncbi:MAG: hypothetical protein V3U76_04245 [Granulosicoccus sp.]